MSAKSLLHPNKLLLCAKNTTLASKLFSRTIFSFFKKLKKEEASFDPSSLPYSYVTPAKVSPRRAFPDYVDQPSYALREDGRPRDAPYYPVIGDADDIKNMRASCAMARKILDMTAKKIKAGVTTEELDEFVHQTCIDNHCYPSPLWYKRFPKSVCTSVNNVLVHGIPDSRPLENGDIINVDVAVYLNGYHGDCSETFAVGEIDKKAQELIDVARLCRDKAIAVCKDLQLISAIGDICHETATAHGFVSCRYFTGHGVGPVFHCKPSIWHYANRYPERMEKNMIFTVEPVILEFDDKLQELEDRWTVTSLTGARSAQFEHTILITDDGCEILTAGENETDVITHENDGQDGIDLYLKKKYKRSEYAPGWKHIREFRSW